jgi:carboxypeptidase family protein/TonB-dependent receptor-like protein
VECGWSVSGRRMSVTALIFVLLVPFAGRSYAGQQAASIIGQVTDESGAILPGVTVTATSPALQLPQVVAVTNERGEYRLNPLPIGTYTVVYSLTGFQDIRREGIRLTVGFTAKLDIVLKVGAMSETVTVSGVTPVVDTTSSGSRTELTKETLELIPTSRNNYGGLMAQAPGTRTNVDVGGEAFNTSPSFHAFGQDNEPWQTLEGIVTVSPKASQTGNYVDYASFEEAKIQTLANDAEVPSRGIAINAVVKSGGNDFHGSGFYAGTSHKLQSSNIDATLEAQGIKDSSSINLRDDISGDIGGRIKMNKLWFYGTARQRRDRETIIACFQPDGSPCLNIQGQTFETAKLTYQMSPSNKFIAFTQWGQKDNGSGASRLVAWESRSHQLVKIWMPKGEWQAIKGNSLVTSLQVGLWKNFTTNPAYPESLGKVATTDNISGVVTGASNAQGQDNQEYRYHTKATVSYYKPDWLGGNHSFRSGFDYTASGANRVMEDRGVNGNYQLIFSNSVPSQISVGNYPVHPDSPIHYLGIFVQDSWTLGRKMTLNLGVRYAHDNAYNAAVCRDAAIGPGSVAFPAACYDKQQFNIWNPISPRLHFAYDVTGDGKTLVKGGWGRFAHMRVTDETQTASRNVISNAIYTWHDINGDKLYEPGEVNLSTTSTDFRSISLSGATGALANGIVNPNETEPWTDEYSLQFEKQLAPSFAVRLTGAYSRAMNQYRLLNTLRPYDVYTIPVTNPDPGPDGLVGTADDPGRSITYYEYPTALNSAAFQAPEIVNDSKANQTYRTIEIAASKRLSNNWQFLASYTATRKHIPLTTNVGGGQAPLFNTVDPNGEIFRNDDTWEWLGRVSGSYVFKYDIMLSGNFEYRSGDPLARQFTFKGGKTITSITLNVEPIGSERLQSPKLLDLRIQKAFPVGKGRKLDLRMNVYNVLNGNWVTTQTVLSGPNYGKATAITSPRIAELSAHFTF